MGLWHFCVQKCKVLKCLYFKISDHLDKKCESPLIDKEYSYDEALELTGRKSPTEIKRIIITFN